MTEETPKHVKGYETNIITTFEKFKGIILDLRRGYPVYLYYGKFESVFAENGRKIVDILYEHKIIEILKENEIKKDKLVDKLPAEEVEKLKQQGITPRFYRLTSKGVELAISMTNMEHSENIIKYSKEMRVFTKIIILLGISTLLFTLEQIFLILFKIPR